MNEATGVGCCEAATRFHEHLEDPLQAGPGQLSPSIEGHALHQLHGDERATGSLAHVEDRDHVRVLHRRDGTRLREQAIARFPGELRTHQLEGDVALKRGIPSGQHQAHAAGADLVLDLVAPQRVGHVTATTLRPRRHTPGTTHEGLSQQLDHAAALVAALQVRFDFCARLGTTTSLNEGAQGVFVGTREGGFHGETPERYP